MKRTNINEKEAGIAPILKKTFSLGLITLTLGPVPGFIF